jgi:hypothetical protein
MYALVPGAPAAPRASSRLSAAGEGGEEWVPAPEEKASEPTDDRVQAEGAALFRLSLASLLSHRWAAPAFSRARVRCAHRIAGCGPGSARPLAHCQRGR